MTDAELIDAFESCLIPLESWKHRTHLRVAWIYLDRHGLDGAIERMRVGIPKLNAANAIIDGIDMGYHDTVTVAWLKIIEATRRAYGLEADSETFLDSHTQLHSKVLLRLFYSRERIMSAEAKVRFIEPDLAPLPRFDA
jgi:hypothetical protein